MGNCIGKKSLSHHEQFRHGSSTKLYSKNGRPKKQMPLLLLSSSSSSTPTSPLNTSSERNSIFPSHLSNVKETDIKLNDNDENERKIIQYSSPVVLPTTTSATNEQLVFMHNTLSTLSPAQLSVECKKFKSSNTSIGFDENHIKQTFKLTTNEENTSMGHLFNKEKDTDKQNDSGDSNIKVNIDISVHKTDNDQSKNHHYFTIINDKIPNKESMIDKREIIQGKKAYISKRFFKFKFSFMHFIYLRIT